MFLNRNIFHGLHSLSYYYRYPLKTALLHSIPSIINVFKIDDEEVRVLQQTSNHDARPKDIKVLQEHQFMQEERQPTVEDLIIVNFITLCARPDYEDDSRYERGCRFGGTQHCKSHHDVLVAIDESTGEPILFMGGYRQLRGDLYQWVNWYAKTDGPLALKFKL